MAKAASNAGGGKPGRPATGRTPTRTLFTRVPPTLGDALDAYIEAQAAQPTTTAVVVAALKKFLGDAGFWPGKPKKPPQP